MKTGIKALIAGIAALCLTGAFTVGYIRINRKYPPPVVEKATVGESLVLRGVEISAEKFELLTPDQVDELATGYLESAMASMPSLKREEYRLLLVTIHMKNVSDETQRTETPTFSAESRAWTNGVNFDLYMFLNKEEDVRTELEPGEEATIVLPYDVMKMHFWEKDWEQIDERSFEVVVNLYPTLQKLTMDK